MEAILRNNSKRKGKNLFRWKKKDLESEKLTLIHTGLFRPPKPCGFKIQMAEAIQNLYDLT